MIADRRPEVMSPAGYWPQLKAAIEAGADAVYFGLQHFSARAKSGFSLTELPEAVQTLHGRGVKAFVTFNTLVFDHELEQAEATLAAIAESGADAIIVQDCGVARLAHAVAPELAIHGSTQMSVTSAEGAELARSFGCSRVVLARELSLADIARIRQQTDLELEVFVHGALCVSYSGQCFSSEAWGGRSANRGQCAQACRLPYDLIVDGARRDLGPLRYLLSPGDLCTVDQIPELVRIGVACLKIEGRYKDADYVAMTTATYRAAVDAAFHGQSYVPSPEQRRDLEQVYSRGLGPWFVSGTNHQTAVDGRAPRHRGLLAGKVHRVHADRVEVVGDLQLSRGDGVVFDAAERNLPGEPEQGGFLYDVHPVGQTASGEEVREVTFADGRIDFSRVAAGDLVWRTLDPTLRRRLKHLTEPSDPVRTQAIDLQLTARIGQPLVLQVSLNGGTADGRSLSVEVSDPALVEVAGKTPTSPDRMREQLARLGGTPFRAGALTIDASPDAFVPVSRLNELRRLGVEQLQAGMQTIPARAINRKALKTLLDATASPSSRIDSQFNQTPPTQTLAATDEADSPAKIHLLVRSADQLEGAIRSNPDSITLDYLELYGLRKSVEAIRESGIAARVASPRVLKPDEQRVIHFLVSLQSPILVRSGGLLHALLKLPPNERPELHGDFSLNIANRLTAQALSSLGLSRWSPSHDLNAEQILDLAKSFPGSGLEQVVFQQLPIFHTEHCVFCRFMTTGTDHTNCGHPCEKHRLALRDGENRQHPVMADVGCRNTVFNAEVQSSSKFLERFRRAGIRHFRLEFVHQSAETVQKVCAAFDQWIKSAIDSDELETVFKATNPGGTTEGSLYVPSGFRQLVSLGGPVK